MFVWPRTGYTQRTTSDQPLHGAPRAQKILITCGILPGAGWDCVRVHGRGCCARGGEQAVKEPFPRARNHSALLLGGSPPRCCGSSREWYVPSHACCNSTGPTYMSTISAIVEVMSWDGTAPPHGHLSSWSLHFRGLAVAVASFKFSQLKSTRRQTPPTCAHMPH